MTIDVGRMFDRLDASVINREVLQKHDIARERFRLPVTRVRDHREFKLILESYVQFHHKMTSGGEIDRKRAFGEAKRILLNEYGKDRFQDGYEAALQMALDGANGGMGAILNVIADALRRRAFEEYKDDIISDFVDPASQSHFDAVSDAFFQRFGPLLAEHGVQINQRSFGMETRAIVEYQLQLVQSILGIGKKILGRP